MAGSGICLVYPSRYGHAQDPKADAVSCMALVFMRLLKGRGASGYDVCDLSDVVYRRSLTANSPEVRSGKYPNAPYHSFIYLYYGFYSGIDRAEHITQSPVNLPTQWASDLNTPGQTVNHYVFGYLSPDDLHNAWPDGTEGPGVGPHVGGSVTLTAPAEQFNCTIAGKTASVLHFGSKVQIPTIPADVAPIFINPAGELVAWSYKNRWHYWYESVQGNNSLFLHSSHWYSFIFWVLAHITKVRGIPLQTNTIQVWLDIDDLARAGIPSWAAKIEADPEGPARFAAAARANGFGKVAIAMEANPQSLAAVPQTVAVLRRLAKTNYVMITPHSHDWIKSVPDPRTIKTEADGVTYLNTSYANLAAQGMPLTRQYLTMPANYVTEPLVRAAYSLGVTMLRGGAWVADSTRSEQPQHIACASGAPVYHSFPGFIYRTGQYTGLATQTGYHFYDWDSLAGGSSPPDPMPLFRLHQYDMFMRGLLIGCDTTDRYGYIWRRHNQLSAHLVFHPNGLTDGDIGVEILNWLGSWNSIYPVFSGVDDPSMFVLNGG